MELDARTAAGCTTVESDVCIVGAGPAGLVVAWELVRAGRSVVVLESGGTRLEPAAQGLNAGEIEGDRYKDLRESRHRQVGGTAAIWNTEFGTAIGAKYVPLSAVDFERREWLPWSGWPFGAEVLEPYYRRAHELCLLGEFDYLATAPAAGAEPLPDLGRTGLVHAVYRYGPAEVFTTVLPGALRREPRATLLFNATVTGFGLNRAGDRLHEARWQAIGGPSGVVRASRFVLAAGGVENAGLLLRLREDEPAGGPGTAWLGRGFMEHPRDRSLVVASAALRRLLRSGGFTFPGPAGGTPLMGRIGISDAVLGSGALVNASLSVVAPEPLLKRFPPDWRALARWRPGLRSLRGLAGRATRRLQRMGDQPVLPLLLHVEQAPHPDNRVTLAGDRDALGNRRLRLAWRWRPADHERLRAVRAVFANGLAEAGVGQVRHAGDPAPDPNAHHHAGTTRMHDDPAHGVVDRQGRAHGFENLYLAGSSTFPTAGFANPTLTVVALALRLADHLQTGGPA